MTDTKHAYLIMAHQDEEVLTRLLKLLDSYNNDIYLHLDRKSNISLKDLRSVVCKSGFYTIKRRNVIWGGDRQIRCELSLMKAAAKKKYQYYHLLSGTDLPIKTQDEIYGFFAAHEGKNYIAFDPEEDLHEHKFGERVKYYYFFQNLIGRGATGIKRLFYYINIVSIKIQKIIGINRLKNWKVELKKGANWFSITHDMLLFILNHEKEIKHFTKYTWCADEIFLQSWAASSPYCDSITYDNARFIDWKRGGPYTFTSNDYEELLQSHKMFARKFSWYIDKNIVNRLYDNIEQQQR